AERLDPRRKRPCLLDRAAGAEAADDGGLVENRQAHRPMLTVRRLRATSGFIGNTAEPAAGRRLYPTSAPKKSFRTRDSPSGMRFVGGGCPCTPTRQKTYPERCKRSS